MITFETIGSVFAGIMGWFFWLIIIFFIAMVFDYASGTLAARKSGEWTSTKARQGLYHKLGIAGALILAVLIDIVIGLASDTVIQLPWTFRGLFSPLVCLWYIITEFGSILENLGKMGVRIPAFLSKSLAALHQATETSAHADTTDNDKTDNEELE